jgi:hypothetical protein
MNESPLEFQTCKKFNNLARVFLETFEDIESDYNDTQSKLLDCISKFNVTPLEKQLLESIIIQGCLFTPAKVSNIRKRILDKANGASRELSEEFKKYKITL